MKKMILCLLSLLVVAMFLVGCAKSGEEGLAGQAVKTTINCESCKHVLTLNEGEVVVISEYQIKLIYIDQTSAKLEVNGQVTDKIGNGKFWTFADGSKIGILDIFYQAYAGGIHRAKVCVR